MPRLIRIVVIVIVVLAVGYGAWRFLSTGTASLIPKGDSAAGKGYTAVFLINDQVYFGKLSTSGKNLVLTDVYYIRLNQTDQTQKDQTQQPQLSLVKLGDQIHGPVDEMRINSDQVLFVERIKDDSTVVKGILQDKEKRASGQNETPASNTQTNTPSNSNTPAATDQKQ